MTDPAPYDEHTPEDQEGLSDGPALAARADWIALPGTLVSHAYSRNALPGDASLCGDTQKPPGNRTTDAYCAACFIVLDEVFGHEISPDPIASPDPLVKVLDGLYDPINLEPTPPPTTVEGCSPNRDSSDHSCQG